MFRRLLQWSFRILVGIVAVLGVALIVQQSEAFTNCVKSRKHTQEYQALHEGGGIVGGAIIRLRVRFRLNYVCVWDFTDKNNGAIIALATMALSAFTYTLWRATDRLWENSRVQSGHMERTIETMERTERRQLRAYVGVARLAIESPSADDPSYQG